MFPVVKAKLSGILENQVDTFIVSQNDGESTVSKLGKIDKLISLIEED